jgi:VanZ family protein
MGRRSVSVNMLRSNQKADSWQLIPGTFVQPVFPAYSIESLEMRPVTKIKLFGLRLAVVVLAVYWLIIFVGTHLPPILDVSPSRINDKVKHFGAFFVLGGLMCYVTNSKKWFRRFATIGMLGMAYAAIDELTQLLVAGRYADKYDFLADSAGVWTAIGIYVAAKYWYQARQRTPLPT